MNKTPFPAIPPLLRSGTSSNQWLLSPLSPSLSVSLSAANQPQQPPLHFLHSQVRHHPTNPRHFRIQVYGISRTCFFQGAPMGLQPKRLAEELGESKALEKAWRTRFNARWSSFTKAPMGLRFAFFPLVVWGRLG